MIDRLKTQLPETTLIVITHKATLLEMVYRVIVVDQGRIVADGPKEVVLKPNANKGSAA